MAALIAHRGPDADGFLVREGVSLANRRLAIIDLSEAGRQPLYNEDGSIGLVYNGELYNFAALRKELMARGHRFRSHSDTEVIVHAYEEYGTACVRRFNGMFAFALWDGRDGSLFIARDRFGVKPLYYTWLGGMLALASEVKAFLALPEFSPRLDAAAAVEYFTSPNLYSSQAKAVDDGDGIYGHGQRGRSGTGVDCPASKRRVHLHRARSGQMGRCARRHYRPERGITPADVGASAP
jgi:asparagine synthase (glutamine-hydrolysing)